jgi:tetratricopeptide (TPR) repeat protein
VVLADSRFFYSLDIILVVGRHLEMKIEETDLTAYGIDQLGRSGMMREALALALEAVQKGEDDGDLYFVAADLAYRLRELDKAAFLVNRLLAKDPEHIGGWVLFGNIFTARGDLIRAGYGRSRAEDLFPALAEMGILDDIPSGSEAGSRERGRRSLSAEELDFETMTFAEICVEQGYHNKALKIYSDLLEKDPGNDKIRSRVAELKKRLDRND